MTELKSMEVNFVEYFPSVIQHMDIKGDQLLIQRNYSDLQLFNLKERLLVESFGVSNQHVLKKSFFVEQYIVCITQDCYVYVFGIDNL